MGSGRLARASSTVITLVVLAACATPRAGKPPEAATSPPRIGWEETGQASWYGHPYHGRRTASGEIYDMRQLTAAHRTLPLGTRALITHLGNGRTVEVRINDRGPFVWGRIVDLSRAAAERLGGLGAGLFPVRLRILGLPDGTREAGGRGPANTK